MLSGLSRNGPQDWWLNFVPESHLPFVRNRIYHFPKNDRELDTGIKDGFEEMKKKQTNKQT